MACVGDGLDKRLQYVAHRCCPQLLECMRRLDGIYKISFEKSAATIILFWIARNQRTQWHTEASIEAEHVKAPSVRPIYIWVFQEPMQYTKQPRLWAYKSA